MSVLLSGMLAAVAEPANGLAVEKTIEGTS